MYNPNVPTRIVISIANAQRAVEYWLNTCVLREGAQVKQVTWSDRDNQFVIDIENPPKERSETD